MLFPAFDVYSKRPPEGCTQKVPEVTEFICVCKSVEIVFQVTVNEGLTWFEVSYQLEI